jgi:hypothetical protein
MTVKNVLAALQTKEAQELLNRGLKFTSSGRQVKNGTIVLRGRIKRQPVSYKITASGAVLSNEYVARQVFASTPKTLYKRGLAAAAELLEKRFG